MLKVKSARLNETFGKVKVIANICSIQSRDFCVIASNCTGTLPYRFLNLPYNTPTVNLFLFAPCYLKFVRHLDYYLSLPLVFNPKSRYKQGEKIRDGYQHHYPIGTLDDIEVHFMHYHDETDARDKWERRKQRINGSNMTLAMTDKDLFTPELLYEFDELDYPNKYVLTAKHWPDIKSAIHVPSFAGQSEIGDCYTHYGHLSQVDFRRIIDGGQADLSRARELPQPALYVAQ